MEKPAFFLIMKSRYLRPGDNTVISATEEDDIDHCLICNLSELISPLLSSNAVFRFIWLDIRSSDIGALIKLDRHSNTAANVARFIADLTPRPSNRLLKNEKQMSCSAKQMSWLLHLPTNNC